MTAPPPPPTMTTFPSFLRLRGISLRIAQVNHDGRWMGGYLGGAAAEPGNFTESVRGTWKNNVRTDGGCNLAILHGTKVSQPARHVGLLTSGQQTNPPLPQHKTMTVSEM